MEQPPPAPHEENGHRNKKLEDESTTSTKNDDDIQFLQAFFTQSDWSGQVCRDSWYNRHHPWTRIFCFLLLSSFCLTMSSLLSLYLSDFVSGGNSIYNKNNHQEGGDNNFDLAFPILQAISEEELAGIKKSHEACFYSFCDDIGHKIPIDCVVNEDGTTARVEFAADEHTNLPPEYIPFPEACHKACEKTFGYRYLAGNEELGTYPVAFMTIQKGPLHPANATTKHTHDQKKDGIATSLLTLLPDCSVTINSSPDLSEEELAAIREKLNIDIKEWEETINQQFKLGNNYNNRNQRHPDIDLLLSFNLLGLPHNKKNRLPGDRERFVLKRILCTDEMPTEVQEEILPTLASFYNFFMDYRHEILTVGICLYHYTMVGWTFGWLMFRLALPTVLLKRLGNWPDKIETIDIWRTLLLVSFISTAYLNTPVLSTIMVLGALYYRDTKAAIEWGWLGILAWGAPDVIYPTLNSIVTMLFGDKEGDGMAMKIARHISHLLVVGEGWWKLVTLYVVYRSYQALQTTWQRPANILEQTRLNIILAQQQQQEIQQRQQQQQQQPEPLPLPPKPVGQEHVKVD